MRLAGTLICCFIIFSIAGWIIETIYRSISNRRLVNPGFLTGFYLPIYGFGGLSILAGHSLLASHSIPIRALFYFVVLTGIEFVTGVAVERLFRTRLWDYRDQRFNIGGHVCLLFSFYWILMGLAFDLSLDFLIPHVLALYERIHPIPDIVLGALALTMFIDLLFSISRRLKERTTQAIEHELPRREFTEIVAPLLAHPGVLKLKDCNHHLSKTRLDHVLDVSWMAYRITKFLSLDSEATARGALLHDLFYYDWLRESPKWHSVRHPRIALHNALQVTALSEKEQEIIKKHMWPLTIVPPRYAESWIVCFSDIYNSWRDYLVPLTLTLIGRRKKWIRLASSRFPAYAVLQNDYIKRQDTCIPFPVMTRENRSLSILLIDARTRVLPFTTFRNLTLPRVAGATPEKHRVKIVDGKVEKITIPTHGVDLVGVTFSCNNAPFAYEIARKARELGILTVAGGTHATAVPDEALGHFDSVLVGEAEGGAWERLLEDASKGSLEDRYSNAEPPDISDLAPPRLDLLRSRLYLPAYPVEATRGCPNRCSFCFSRYIHRTYRKRPVSQVVKDVSRADRNNIFFMDDNITADVNYAKELFTALIPLKKRLYFQMQLRAAENEELVRFAAEAGGRGIFTGLESICAESLDSVEKSFNKVEKYKEQIATLDRHGILVVGGLIFGLDADDKNVFKQTMEFLRDSKICSVAVNLAIPYPGTEYHAQKRSEGCLLECDYKSYTGYNLIICPKGMASDDLEHGYDNFIKQFYSARNIIGRFRQQHRSLRQLPMYIAVNLAFRFPRRAKSRSLWN
jgi:uncharacterized protein